MVEISCNNFFADLSLERQLLNKRLLITQKKTLLQEFTKTRGDKLQAISLDSKCSLYSTIDFFALKKNTSVNMFSTIHFQANVGTNSEQKPLKILFNNKTKNGVDVFDNGEHT